MHRDGRKQWALGLGMMVLGCVPRSAPVEPATTTTPTPAQRREIVPRVAHHQHLMSPASVTLLASKQGLPPVQLPAPLAELLHRREELCGGGAPLDVYMEDARIIEVSDERWARGRAAAETMASRYTPDARFVASGYGLAEKTGWIAGTVRGEGKDRDEMNFLLTVEKGADGVWRIAAEAATPQPPPAYSAPVTADDLIAQLDDARIDRGVVFSTAYWWASPKHSVEAPHEKVRADNDWTAAQVARYPDRLVFFCGVNPLDEHALDELERCATLPQMKGIKLHFGNSRVDIKHPEHVKKLRGLFAAANQRRLAIVVHLRTRDPAYGRADSEILINEVLTAAPDIPVQVAHLAGAGPGYGPDDAMAAFAEAIAAGDPRTKRLLFDLTTVVTADTTPETAALIVKRLRQVGLERVLFGSDMAIGDNPAAAPAWATIRRKLPLTDEELRTIADNVAPYLR